ncbi:hypothetical protein [Hydrogenovibrio sp. JE_KL2]|uniref:hypothetical protein n=1 Tax=Hydrogenovibrio sp. JE_KL2 TaxID=2651188 RepID=UPI00128CD51D|nr:hypothetical protein [Hydrogenovibrio sp. JE_KL2]MPQ76970.1 hypothetical protein [Hydrogenovibrio sp. JE_KL2]
MTKFWLMALGLAFGLTASFQSFAEQAAYQQRDLSQQTPQSNSATPYPTKCVTATGTASTDGVTEAYARKMAIRDALKLASMQSNLRVSSAQEVKDFALSNDVTRFTTHSKVSGFKVVKEGFKELPFDEQFDKDGKPLKDTRSKTYQVTLKVCLTEDPLACSNYPGNQYQPKLAIAQVVTTDGYGARDISNLLSGYQLELNRRIRDLGYLNETMLETGSQLTESPSMVAPNLSRDVLQPIRETTGAQYLMMTVLRSLSRHNTDPAVWNKIKGYYDLEVKPNARYIEADSYIIDLTTFQIVFQKRYGFDIKGKVTVGRDRPFGTNAFFATNTGMAFHAMLQQQSRDAYRYLHCQPLKTRIIDIRNGEYILYLSEESGAKVGDELAVYHQFGSSVQYQGQNLGFDSVPAGFLKIERIQSKFAVAKVTAEKGLIQVGDEVRSW